VKSNIWIDRGSAGNLISMNTINSFISERIDDLPLLFEQMHTLEIAPILDRNLKPHGNRKGTTFGWTSVIWLAHILSRGDHRMNHVRGCVQQTLHTIQACVPVPIADLDFTDDRLADVLEALSDDAAWQAIQTDLNRQTITVFELPTDLVRLDATTITVDTDPRGLLKMGHSKDHRPDAPQVKVMMASLDPLAMPLVTQIVAGNSADDPLYLPAVEAVRASLKKTGLLYVGDCKMASLPTRKGIAVGDDFYLCPLSAVQMPVEQLASRFEPVLKGEQQLQAIWRPDQNGEMKRIAEGFEWVETLQQDGFIWQERRLLIRSDAYRDAASRLLDNHLCAACQEIRKLGDRGKGKRPPQDPQAFQTAIDKILSAHRVEGLIAVDMDVKVIVRKVRGYKGQPDRTETVYDIGVSCHIDAQAVEAAKELLGCRVFVTNACVERMSLEEAVLTYRDEYRIETNFARLKGQPLSIAPMYLLREDHIKGLIRLLSIGLRLLTLLEFVVGKRLAEAGETLSGLYAGNAKRSTAKPTAELLLEAFKHITLLIIPQNGHPIRYLNPLTELQQRILELLGYSADVYAKLATNSGISPEK
jgi:transposase